MKNAIFDAYLKQESEINDWIDSLAPHKDRPIYTSVDIRESEDKLSGIDTNLFPAGFNNLCMFSIQRAHDVFQKAILSKNPNCKHLLLICEEHTRNKWYLENVYNIKLIANKAGFKVTIATFMNDSLKEINADYIDVESQLGNELRIHRLKPIIDTIKDKNADIDLILLNNDLSDGIPEEILQSNIPIFPSPCVGWHNRKKSTHFKWFNQIAADLCKKLDPKGGLDPWFISTLFKEVENIDINIQDDRQLLYENAKTLLADIQTKYDQYNIKESPYIFLKANSGTYGMGVVAIYDANEILELNRKARNKLYKGKGSVPITNYILQEGIKSTVTVEDQSAELVVYLINNTSIGSFYRVNSDKNSSDNLNSTGMHFKRVCAKANREPLDDAQYNANEDCGIILPGHDQKCYDLIGRIAGIAAAHEKEENDEDCLFNGPT